MNVHMYISVSTYAYIHHEPRRARNIYGHIYIYIYISAEASMASGRVEADLSDIKPSYPLNLQILGRVYPPLTPPSAPAHLVVPRLEPPPCPKDSTLLLP